MIAEHQPRCFDDRLLKVMLSSRQQGCIRYLDYDAEAAENIATWFGKLQIDPAQGVGVLVTYGDQRDYCDIVEVTQPIHAKGLLDSVGWQSCDALVTNVPDLTLLLPVADCNAVIYHDPTHQVLALAHLGWHSTVRDLASKCVEFMKDNHQTDPAELKLWFSPSIRRESYRFSHLEPVGNPMWRQPPYAVRQDDGHYAIDLVRYNIDQLLSTGVVPANIDVSPIDTALSQDYFSHRARHQSAERGNGRFAVAARLRR